MPKDISPTPLLIGESKTRRGPAENDASWSIPGIISCTIAVVLGVASTAVAKLMDPRSSGSKPFVLFWTAVVFGLGIGAGMGLAGLMRMRSSKLSPAVGFLLNVALFAMFIWLIAVGSPKPPMQSRGPGRALDSGPP